MSLISKLIMFPDITVLSKYVIPIMHLPITRYSEISLFHSRSKLITFLNVVWERDYFEKNQTIRCSFLLFRPPLTSQKTCQES